MNYFLLSQGKKKESFFNLFLGNIILKLFCEKDVDLDGFETREACCSLVTLCKLVVLLNMDFANRWVWFFRSHGLLFINSGVFALNEPAEVFKSDWKLCPSSFLLSWRKLCVAVSKSYWQGTLVSTALFSSPLKENFSPDGSILVIWIFRAPFEILRQLICKNQGCAVPVRSVSY